MNDVKNALSILLIQMIEPFCWYWFWGKIAEPKEEWKKYRVVGLVGMCLFSTGANILTGAFENIPLLKYCIGNWSLFIFAFYAIIFYEVTFKQCAAYIMIMSILGALTEYILCVVVFVCSDIIKSNLMENPLVILFCIGGIRLLHLYYQYIIVKLFVAHGKILEDISVLRIVFLGYVTYFIPFGYAYCCGRINNYHDLQMIIFLGLVNFFEASIICVTVYVAISAKRMKSQYEVTLDYTRNQLAMFDEIQRKLDINQNLMHDMKNHICAMDSLVASGMTEEARKYAAELLPELHNAAAVGLSGSVISVILYSKRTVAKEKFIDLRCGIAVSNIEIPLHDLNAIITNLLDNAIEACEKITNWKKRQILFRVFVEGECVIIECENTYNGKMEFKPSGAIATTKKDRINHGFGLRRIDDCARKNGGEFIYEVSQKTFLARVFFHKEIATLEED